MQMWRGCAQSRCRCGSGKPSPGADVTGVRPGPVRMWAGHGRGTRGVSVDGASSQVHFNVKLEWQGDDSVLEYGVLLTLPPMS